MGIIISVILALMLCYFLLDIATTVIRIFVTVWQYVNSSYQITRP